MNEGSHGKEKPSYNLFVPDTTSKDIDFRLKGKGMKSGLDQTNELELDQTDMPASAVGTFKLKGSQFKNVPRGWIAVNSSQHDVSLGFDSNKNYVAELMKYSHFLHRSDQRSHTRRPSHAENI